MQCPSRVADGLEGFFAAYAMLMKYNVLPNGTSLAHQTAWFLDAVAIADAERSKLEEERNERLSRQGRGGPGAIPLD